VPLQLVTLGKALGGYGAAVVGDADLIEHLAQTARPYIYTTALPPAQAAATLAAVKLARSEDWRRGKLYDLIAHFRERADRAGLVLLPSETPIQPVMCGSDTRALSMSATLEQRGYWVAAIRPPTVPEGRARLRVTLSALHYARRCRRTGGCAGTRARQGRGRGARRRNAALSACATRKLRPAQR
jgi:8-amino-7-oxononanoate synthase